MQRIFIFAAVLISYFLITDGNEKSVCNFKKPMDDFKDEYLFGTYYLVAEKVSFDMQSGLLHCGRVDTIDLGNEYYQFILSYQNSIGQVLNVVDKYENSPPGYFTASTSNNDTIFVSTILGAKNNSYLVSQACNFEKGTDALWVLTRRRVNGFDSLDEETRNEIETILRNNHIDRRSLRMVDNTNCNN